MKYFYSGLFMTIFIVNNILSQNLKNIDYNDMAKTYGYYFGIEKALECLILRNNNLKSSAYNYKLKLINSHKKAFDSVTNALKINYGEDFDNIHQKLLNSINCDQITEQFLYDFENSKIKGKDPQAQEHVKRLLKYNPKYQKNSLGELLDGYKTRIYTNNHIKSKGLNYNIELPLSWEIAEGNRPNIIYKAINQRDKRVMFTLLTKEYIDSIEFNKMIFEAEDNLNENEFYDILADAMFTEEFISNISGNNKGETIRTKIDGQPALISSNVLENERVGLKMKIHQRIAVVIYKNYLINIALAINEYEFDSTFNYNNIENNFELLFKYIINTLVIEDKWQNKSKF